MSDEPTLAIVPAVTTVAEYSRIEDHPAIEVLYEFIHKGVVDFDGRTIDKQTLLVQAINDKYPDKTIYPNYVTRLKKRVMRGKDGYMVKDGDVYYADGSLVIPIDIKKFLRSFIQIGLEQLVAHPENIKGMDIIKAIQAWMQLSEGDDRSDIAVQGWTEYQKLDAAQRRGRKRSSTRKRLTVETETVEETVDAAPSAESAQPPQDAEEGEYEEIDWPELPASPEPE